MNAQLLETMSALAQRETEVGAMSRELQSYSNSFERMHQQQAARTLALPLTPTPTLTLTLTLTLTPGAQGHRAPGGPQCQAGGG